MSLSYDILDLLRTSSPYSASLISSLPGHRHSQKSFFGIQPRAVWSSRGPLATLQILDSAQAETFEEPLAENFYRIWKQLAGKGCWAMGYWGYDWKDSLEVLRDNSKRDWDIPDNCWIFFDAVLELDHASGKWTQHGSGDAIRSVPDFASPLGSPRAFSVRPMMAKDDYLRSVEGIRSKIELGDVYEVNFTQRFDLDISNYQGRDADLMEALMHRTPSPFSAMIRTPEFSVISSSPERFLRLHEGRLESEPIKGTRPRGRNFDSDEANFLSLIHSEKDRAENLMIVDLARNDLGRVAKAGTVKVPRLFGVDRYETVFQMSSNVEAEMKPGVRWIDAITAAFPPGSMTGAPKIAAMTVIGELEPLRRQIYSGALGYISPSGDFDLSVIIRTLVLQQDRGYFQTGGAIVWDSDPETEYQECLDKARGIIDSLNAWSEVTDVQRRG